MCGDDLQDLRAKITRRTHAMLLAERAASGDEISEIVRDVLDKWAAGRIHAASVVANVLRGEGYLGESEGAARESQGTRGNRP